jgi:uncharacterized protein YqjF (DUF2071 family)
MSTTADSPFVRQLTVTDLSAMVALQEAVTAKLPVGFVRSKTESEVRAYLDGTHGIAYGMVEGSALLAISLLRIPNENHLMPVCRSLSCLRRTGRSARAFSRTRWFYQRHGAVDITESC